MQIRFFPAGMGRRTKFKADYAARICRWQIKKILFYLHGKINDVEFFLFSFLVKKRSFGNLFNVGITRITPMFLKKQMKLAPVQLKSTRLSD